MPDQDGKAVLDTLASMESARATWEGHWDELARFTRPTADIFKGTRTDGEKRGQWIYDATPVQLVQQCASILDSTITPRNDRYHGLQTTIPELNRIPAVKAYYERLTDILFQKRYEPAANFVVSQWETWLNIVVFGSGPKFIGKRDGAMGLFYRAMQLKEIYARQDNQGRIDTIYRKYDLTARQAAQEFGLENLPEKIREAAVNENRSHRETKFEFVHAVQPNSDFKPGKLRPDYWKFRSFHVACQDSHTIRRGGYRVMPYPMGRMSTDAGETYGRSLTMTALPDIKMLNQMAKARIVNAHRANDPLILTANDGIFSSKDNRPGAVVSGGISEDGKRLVDYMYPGSNWQVAELENARVINNLKDLYMVNLIQLLRDNPQMTATEVMEKSYEKGMLIAPTVGRLQSEDQGPTIMREIDLLDAMGLFPDPPPELAEAASEFEVVYTAPLNRAQKAEMARGSAMTVQEAINLAAVDPSVLDSVNFDEYLQVYGEAGGASMRIFRDPREVAAMRQAREQQQQMAALMEAAPAASKAALDVARARKTEAEIPARI